MALVKPTYIAKGDHTYQNAYHRIMKFNYRGEDEQISCAVWTYQDEDVASAHPSDPMEKDSFSISLDEFNGKGDINMSTIYKALKKLDRFLDAQDAQIEKAQLS